MALEGFLSYSFEEYIGSLALAVDLERGRRFVGTVAEMNDRVCRIVVRGGAELEKGDKLRIAFKTNEGQATVDAQVAIAKESKLVVVLTGMPQQYKPRSSMRKAVQNVTATVETDRFRTIIDVLDISDGGFRFRSDVPLGEGGELAVQFSFGGLDTETICQIVRQSQEADGSYTGGAKFCPKSRIEMARLRQQIQFAA